MTDVRVEVFTGPREQLRASFELAEDSPAELASVDGIPLRDRVWLDRPVARS